MKPPCICASRPIGLITSPASTAMTALVTRGPVTALRTFLSTVRGRQSISTRTAVQPLYSLWTAMPWAVPSGIFRPQFPRSATASIAARTRSLRHSSNRSSSGSLPIRRASSSMVSSAATHTSGL